MSGPRKSASSIPFRLLPNAGSWAIPSRDALFLVLTEENYRRYYHATPRGADFTQNIYLLACWGIKPNSGYKLSIVQIGQHDSEVIVRIRLVEPEPSKLYPQVATRPLIVAEVAKASLYPRGLLTFVFMEEKGPQLASLQTYVSP